jgi:copper chaperone
MLVRDLQGSRKGHIMNHIFSVEGMVCAHCEKAITQAVLALDAQAQVVIARQDKLVRIDSACSRDALAQAMIAQDYQVIA